MPRCIFHICHMGLLVLIVITVTEWNALADRTVPGGASNIWTSTTNVLMSVVIRELRDGAVESVIEELDCNTNYLASGRIRATVTVDKCDATPMLTIWCDKVESGTAKKRQIDSIQSVILMFWRGMMRWRIVCEKRPGYDRIEWRSSVRIAPGENELIKEIVAELQKFRQDTIFALDVSEWDGRTVADSVGPRGQPPKEDSAEKPSADAASGHD